MAMTPSGRANAIYNAIISSGDNIDKLSVAEKARMKAAIQKVWGDDGGGNGDLLYIQGNADVLPAAHSGEALNASVGIAGTVTSGPGSGGNTITNALGPIEGKGSIT